MKFTVGEGSMKTGGRKFLGSLKAMVDSSRRQGMNWLLSHTRW